MYVHVDARGQVSLQAQDEFRAFELRVQGGMTAEGLAQALDGIAELDSEGFSWVHEDWLAGQLSLRPSVPDWRASLEMMVRYAQGKGWTRTEPRRIRAHVVPD